MGEKTFTSSRAGRLGWAGNGRIKQLRLNSGGVMFDIVSESTYRIVSDLISTKGSINVQGFHLYSRPIVSELS